MGYSIEPIAANCYEGTTCLINKLDITDENVLALVEADITFAKALKLDKEPISNTFNFQHYKAIHRFLFEDLYSWAGEIRTVNISKKGTKFVDCNEIENIAENCFKRLKIHNYYKDMQFDDFIDNLADFYITTNMLHPFREGNGRTQRIFITQLIRCCGYDINFSDIDVDELMIATINSANGLNDQLKEIFKRSIIKDGD